MAFRFATAVAFAAWLICGNLGASEPNETFVRSTVLSPGTFYVEEALTTGSSAPDTLLGIRHFTDVVLLDDDQSMYGDGLASGLQNVPAPLDDDSIDFVISGTGDDGFTGSHLEFGRYKVFVDLFSSSGDPLSSVNRAGFLAPGLVDEYSIPVAADFDGRYNVNIDNTTGANDIDFFTFTGLTAGVPFVVRTLDTTSSNIDTLLGRFSSSGTLLEANDNGGAALLSLIDGIVPAEGMLTFAVTGSADAGFIGSHSETGIYALELIVDAGAERSDYNGNGIVDAADYTIWRDTLGSMTTLAADGDANGTVDAGDYNVWKMNFGIAAPAIGRTVTAVPEPSTWWLVLVIFGLAAMFPKVICRCGDYQGALTGKRAKLAAPGYLAQNT